MPTERSGSANAARRGSPRAGRHRAPQAPSSTGKVLRSAGAVTAIVGSGLAVTAAPAGAATADDFAKLRQCESGGRYDINTGNGYYGAYQFDQRTWNGLGYSGLPSDNPPAVQDEAAYKLYDSRGWRPWPACAAKLGLTSNGPAPASSGAGAGVVEQAITPVVPPMTLDTARAEVQTTGFTGTPLTTDLAGEISAEAFVWQAEMREKRFILEVDGRFGAQSQGVASLFSYLTRVSDGQDGMVGSNIWNATVTS